ncbi:MAG: hypothetical protein CVV58_06570 [Tenericutes bacterium HGW-Tenericutes-3]|nr:MAG: hypothetical protein CVV58_06570 [Tenericutes bacterium HGW-Tenericutes-3]
MENNMKNKYFPEATIRLKMDYGVNVVDDVILGGRDRVILYAETKDPNNLLFHVIAGSLNLIGFEDKPSITLNQILSKFNYENIYAKHGGKEEHFNDVKRQILNLKANVDVTFPIIVHNTEHWLRYTSSIITRNPKLISVVIDNVTDYYQVELEKFEKTHTDSLTKLYNKYTLDYHYGLRYQKEGIHVIYLDIDNFKQINDTDGHDAGDLCLKVFSEILISHQKDYNLFYRIGGDEFVGLLFGSTSFVKQVAEDILKRVRMIQMPKSKKLITVSMGIIKGTMSDNLIVKADQILYEAKQAGKDQYIYKVEAE